MVKLNGKIDSVTFGFIKSDIEEAKDEKGIYTTKIIESQLESLKIEKIPNVFNTKRCEFVYKRPYGKLVQGVKYNGGDQCVNKAVSKPGNKYCCSHKRSVQAIKIEKATNGDNTTRCEFVYKRSYTNLAEDIKYDKQERCTNEVILKPGIRYCYFHNWSNQAKAKKTAGIDNTIMCEFVYKKSHTLFTEGIIHKKGEKCANEAIPKSGIRYCYAHKSSNQAKKAEELRKGTLIPYKEYYCNPAKELTLLYGAVYTDTTNMVVQKNSDPLSGIKWIVICRSKVDQLGNRILIKLTQNAINKLNDEKETNNYNFIIKPKLFRQVVHDYSDSQIIHNPLSHTFSKLDRKHIDLLSKNMLFKTCKGLAYKLEACKYNIPYKDLINESEYEEWFG